MKKSNLFRNGSILLVLVLLMGLGFGCAGKRIAQPCEMRVPTPIADNSGKYMCPYTSDEVMAEWTDKALNAALGSTIGKAAGAYAGQKALEQVPFVGGILGGKLGEAIGKKIAIESSGGWEYINATSDLSFNNIDNLAVYIYAKHSNHDHFQEALKATMEIYPELKKRYQLALVAASN